MLKTKAGEATSLTEDDSNGALAQLFKLQFPGREVRRRAVGLRQQAERVRQQLPAALGLHSAHQAEKVQPVRRHLDFSI